MELPALPPSLDLDKEFPSRGKWLFFQHSGISPLPRRSAEAICRYVENMRDDSYLTGKWYKHMEAVRAQAAKLINATADEVAFAKNTSEGVAFVANGLSWKAGDEILSTSVEYPANVYPWIDLEQRSGIKHVMVKERNGRIELEDLFAAVTARTRMIAISHVEFGSGYRSDLAAIGKFCRDRGIFFCVDAIQSCGAIPVDVRAMNIDFLASGGHKWLMGPEGLAIFYCRKELIESVHPEVGSMNVVKPQQYSPYDFTLKSDARRFECGAYNIAGTVGLGASLQMLLELGIDLVWKRVYALTTMLVEGLKEKGYQVYSPREREAECSGIVSFHSTAHDMDAIIQELESKRIIIVKRLGRLRAAPHFYQDPSHIRGLLDALPAH